MALRRSLLSPPPHPPTHPPSPHCTRSHCGCRRGQQRHLRRGLEIASFYFIFFPSRDSCKAKRQHNWNNVNFREKKTQGNSPTVFGCELLSNRSSMMMIITVIILYCAIWFRGWVCVCFVWEMQRVRVRKMLPTWRTGDNCRLVERM